MSKLRNRLTITQDLKKTIAEDKESRGSKKSDKRFLNYWDLPFEGKMKIVLVPDVNGQLMKKYAIHGPKMDVRGLPSVGCSRVNQGLECSICDVGFDIIRESKDLKSVTQQKKMKEAGKAWLQKDCTLLSCIVIDSGDVEVQQTEDGNEVKLFMVPYKVEEMIKNAIEDGLIDQEDIPNTALVIKKTRQAGSDVASYEHSFFERKKLADEVLDAFDSDDVVVNLFDYEDLDVIPADPTESEANEWINTAYAKLKTASNSNSKDSDEDEDDTPSNSKEKSEPRNRSRVRDEEDDDTSDDEGRDGQQEEKTEPVKKSGSLADRLKKINKQ